MAVDRGGLNYPIRTEYDPKGVDACLRDLQRVRDAANGVRSVGASGNAFAASMRDVASATRDAASATRESAKAITIRERAARGNDKIQQDRAIRLEQETQALRDGLPELVEKLGLLSQEEKAYRDLNKEIATADVARRKEEIAAKAGIQTKKAQADAARELANAEKAAAAEQKRIADAHKEAAAIARETEQEAAKAATAEQKRVAARRREADAIAREEAAAARRRAQEAGRAAEAEQRRVATAQREALAIERERAAEEQRAARQAQQAAARQATQEARRIRDAQREAAAIEQERVRQRREELRFQSVSEEAQQRVARTARERSIEEALRARGFDRQGRSLREVAAETERTSRAGNSLFFTFRRLFGAFAAFALLREGVAAIGATLRGAIQLNAAFEAAQVGIAAVATSVGQVRDATGQTVTGAKAFVLAQREAAKQTRRLRQDALETAFSFQELVETFQTALGPGLAAGFDPDQVRKFTVSIAQAAAALGLEGNQLAEEIRSIFSGAITPRTTRIATALGITNDDIKRAKEAGNLAAFLDEKFKSFNIAGKASLQTFTTILSNVRDAFEQVLGAGGLALFNEVKASLQSIQKLLLVKDKDGLLTPRPEVVATFRALLSPLERALKVFNEGNADASSLLKSLTALGNILGNVSELTAFVFREFREAQSKIDRGFELLAGKARVVLQALAAGGSFTAKALLIGFDAALKNTEQHQTVVESKFKKIDTSIGAARRQAEGFADTVKGLADDLRAAQIDRQLAEVRGSSPGDETKLRRTEVHLRAQEQLRENALTLDRERVTQEQRILGIRTQLARVDSTIGDLSARGRADVAAAASALERLFKLRSDLATAEVSGQGDLVRVLNEAVRAQEQFISQTFKEGISGLAERRLLLVRQEEDAVGQVKTILDDRRKIEVGIDAVTKERLRTIQLEADAARDAQLREEARQAAAQNAEDAEQRLQEQKQLAADTASIQAETQGARRANAAAATRLGTLQAVVETENQLAESQRQRFVLEQQRAELEAGVATLLPEQVGERELENEKIRQKNAEIERTFVQEQAITAELERRQRIATDPIGAGVEEAFQAVRDTAQVTFDATVQILQGTVQSFASFISDAIVDAFDPDSDQTLSERFRSFLNGILKMVLQMLAQIAIAKAVVAAIDIIGGAAGAPGIGTIGASGAGGIFGTLSSAFGGAEGGIAPRRARASLAHFARPRGFAHGGLARPSGLDPRDTVPVWVRPGEGLIRPEAVMRYGVDFLGAINSFAIDPFQARALAGVGASAALRTPSAPGFAEGGIAPRSAPASQQGVNIVPAIVTDPASMEKLATAGWGQQLRLMRDRRDEARAALGLD